MKPILIVEDDIFLSEVLVDNLKLDGYKTETAFDGEEAIARIKELHPSLVLLDLMLPKKDGFEILKEVRADPSISAIPVIILSNLGESEDIKRALDMGANDYFIKAEHAVAEIMEKVHKYVKIEDQPKEEPEVVTIPRPVDFD